MIIEQMVKKSTVKKNDSKTSGEKGGSKKTKKNTTPLVKKEKGSKAGKKVVKSETKVLPADGTKKVKKSELKKSELKKNSGKNKFSGTGKNSVNNQEIRETLVDPMRRHIFHEELTPLLVKSLAKNKYTEKEISKILGMTETTFNDWKKKFPKLLESLKEGNASADDLVVNALLRRALGFSYTEYKEGTSRKNGKYTETTRKYVVPNVTACFGWLNNRDPKNWRHKKDKEPEEMSNVQQDNEFSNMSTKELVNCIKEMESAGNE